MTLMELAYKYIGLHIFLDISDKIHKKLCARIYFQAAQKNLTIMYAHAYIFYIAISMKIQINSIAELGLLVRATRRAHKLRLDDVAGSANVGPVFVGDVEHGKETIQMGRVLKLLDELGIKVLVDIPQVALPEFEKLMKVGLKPRKPRSKVIKTKE